MVSPTLDTVLRQARNDSVEFPYLLANHAPMILIALQQIGASERRIAEWYECYKSREGLVPLPPPVRPITVAGWDKALGERARETDYRTFFAAETQRLGIDGAIRHYVPALVSGVAASALHPLMRLAYGVLKLDKDEVGAALGYWAACHLPLENPPVCVSTCEPADILALVAQVEGIRDYKAETDLLWHNIRAVAALPGFVPLIGRLEFNSATPGRMAAAALALYAATMDFAALHAVTSLHWIRLVSKHLDCPEPLYRAVWQVVAALVPKIGFPEFPTAEVLQEMRMRTVPGWQDIKAAAIASDDEHDVSLVFSASQEEQVWQDRLYRVVSARRVGLID